MINHFSASSLSFGKENCMLFSTVSFFSFIFIKYEIILPGLYIVDCCVSLG